MRDVNKWKAGWLSIKKNNDIIHVKISEVVWVVDKGDIRWIVVRGDKETYWEVTTDAEDIMNMMK